MKIFLGADHAGFRLKEQLKFFLTRLGHDVLDLGAKRLSPGDDYPKYALVVGRAVGRNKESRGVLVCGSGVGMAIVANKIRGIRAVNAWSGAIARLSRNDEDANVLCLSGRFLSVRQAKTILRQWLATPFSTNRRHQRRVTEITRLERR